MDDQQSQAKMCDVSPAAKTMASGVKPRTFRQNTMFNLVGGGLMALYAILLPLVLSRAMDTATYSAYILGVQVIPFLLLLATPIQVSLGPKFAQLFAANATAEAAALVRLAALLFAAAGFIAATVAVVLSLLLPSLLGWGAAFSIVASKSVLVLGIAAAFTFPAFIVTSYSAGNRNFLWDNLLKILGPYLGLTLITVAVVVASQSAQSITVNVIIGLAATSTLLASIIIVGFGLKRLPSIKGVHLRLMPVALRLLSGNVRGVLWMQICALVTVGAGPFFVSSVAPTLVAAYVVSSSLMTVIAGVSSALAGPFSVKMAAEVMSDIANRRALFQRLQRPFLLFLYCSTIAVLCMPNVVLTLWVGAKLGDEVQLLLLPLAMGHCLRQITATYSAAVLGLGLQGKLWLSPVVEAFASAVLSYLLSLSFGAVGVAYGFFAAALLRLTLVVFYDRRITKTVLPLTIFDLLFPWRLLRA